MSSTNTNTDFDPGVIISSKPPEKIEEIKPPIEYNDKTYRSWVENGFEEHVPHQVSSPHNFIQEFFTRFDEKNGPIDREVTHMIRLRDRDYTSKNKEYKEYLIYYENWSAKDFLGNKIAIVGHTEGVWHEQERAAVIDERRRITHYKRSGQHIRYDYPFDPKTVDRIIDSSIGSDRETIKFVIKAPPRRDNFSYFMFNNLSWNDAQNILFSPGGASGSLAQETEARLRSEISTKKSK